MSRIPEIENGSYTWPKTLTSPHGYSDNNDCLVAMATRRQKAAIIVLAITYIRVIFVDKNDTLRVKTKLSVINF